MSLFKNSTPAVIEEQDAEATGLPAGHDDPASWYFVPESLRESWVEWAPSAPLNDIATAQQFVALTRAREDQDHDWIESGDAADWARQERREAPTLPNEVFRAYPRNTLRAGENLHIGRQYESSDLGNRIARYLVEEHDEIREMTLHALRATWVNEHRRNDEMRKQDRERIYQAFLCPVCGESVPKRMWIVEPRPVTSWPGGDKDLTSCGPCFAVAMAEGTRLSEMQHPLDGDRDRLDIVRAAMRDSSSRVFE